MAASLLSPFPAPQRREPDAAALPAGPEDGRGRRAGGRAGGEHPPSVPGPAEQILQGSLVFLPPESEVHLVQQHEAPEQGEAGRAERAGRPGLFGAGEWLQVTGPVPAASASCCSQNSAARARPFESDETVSPFSPKFAGSGSSRVSRVRLALVGRLCQRPIVGLLCEQPGQRRAGCGPAACRASGRQVTSF